MSGIGLIRPNVCLVCLGVVVITHQPRFSLYRSFRSAMRMGMEKRRVYYVKITERKTMEAIMAELLASVTISLCVRNLPENSYSSYFFH